MTISVFVLVPSGIVLATDSRQLIESVGGATRLDSDNAYKIFQLGPCIAVITVGQGTFYSHKTESPQPINEILLNLRSSISPASTLSDAAQYIKKELAARLKNHMDVVGGKNSRISFYVAGFNQKDNFGELLRCDVPGKTIVERKTSDAGLVWGGDGQIINRLILGYDKALFEFLPTPTDQQEFRATLLHTCSKLQFYINFQTMPLQDAIDLATLLVRTTIDLQRLSNGLICAPGHFPTCGGAIEVAVITKQEGFFWIQHKQLGIKS